jgi:hypothetical protein
VNRLEVFGRDSPSRNARFAHQAQCDVADQVFDKFRVVVGTLSDPLLVRTLEQSVDFAGSLVFGQTHQFVWRHSGAQSRADGDVRALVVCPVVADFLGTWAETGHRGHDLEGQFRGPSFAFGDNHAHIVVKQALDAGDRGDLVDEVGESKFNLAALCIQSQQHVVENAQQAIDVQRRTTPFQDLDEAGHVRALDVGRQTD